MLDKLAAEGSISQDKSKELSEYYRKLLDEGQCTVEQWRPMTEHSVDWTPYLGHDWDDEYDASMPLDKLKALADNIASVTLKIIRYNLVLRKYTMIVRKWLLVKNYLTGVLLKT